MDWQTDRREYAPPKPPLTLQIALGVAAGILIAIAIIWAVVGWRARVALEQASKSMTAVQTDLAQHHAAERARRAQVELQRKQDIEGQRQARADAQRAFDDRKRAALAEADRKELAWATYYRKPARCDPPAEDAFVECSNLYIRAKRKFEAEWAAGKL